ncbi:MAG: aconitase X [Actinomycetota bacterium]
MTLRLTSSDRAALDGGRGEGHALAMRIVVAAAEAMGASGLLDITGAHVDGCLYHGRAGLDFVDALVEGGAEVAVPTTLNVGSLDLLHPELVRHDEGTGRAAAQLMAGYEALGCRPTWTCAPYQLGERPGQGQQVAWAESNAIAFANSVLGARTERYGDFLDISAAITGRAPAVGLHLDEGRRPELVLSVEGLGGDLGEDETVFPLVGHVLGREAGTRVAAIVGLPSSTTEDDLKALGAAAASSGAVAMFHAVGITPEAPTLSELEDRDLPIVEVSRGMLDEAMRSLSTTSAGRVDAVSVGTPHYSVPQMERLLELLGGRRCRVPLFVSTGRHVLEQWGREKATALREAGVQIVTDTCTYITPIISPDVEVIMTDSAKWAYYAPSNLGVEVVYGSTRACVETAVTGEVEPR